MSRATQSQDDARDRADRAARTARAAKRYADQAANRADEATEAAAEARAAADRLDRQAAIDAHAKASAKAAIAADDRVKACVFAAISLEAAGPSLRVAEAHAEAALYAAAAAATDAARAVEAANEAAREAAKVAEEFADEATPLPGFRTVVGAMEHNLLAVGDPVIRETAACAVKKLQAHDGRVETWKIGGLVTWMLPHLISIREACEAAGDSPAVSAMRAAERLVEAWTKVRP